MFIVAVVISGLTQRVRDQAEAARAQRAANGAPLRAEPRARGEDARDGVVARRRAARRARSSTAHVGDLRCPTSGGARNRVRRPRRCGRRSLGRQGARRRRVGRGSNGQPGGPRHRHASVGAVALYVPLVRVGRRERARRARHLRRRRRSASRTPSSASTSPTLRRADRDARSSARASRRRRSARASGRGRAAAQLAPQLGVARSPHAARRDHGRRSTLLDDDETLEPSRARDLTETHPARRPSASNRLVSNLLDMTRLESGAVDVKKEWQSRRGGRRRCARPRRVAARRPHRDDRASPRDLPLVPFDAVLIEQVLVNLLENAVEVHAAGRADRRRARSGGEGEVEIEVADRGPGLPAGRASSASSRSSTAAARGRGGGVGLGLTICQGIVDGARRHDLGGEP